MSNHVNENTINVTHYELMSKLPDPFLFNDGTGVKTKDDWKKRREELYEKTVELHFGGMPPKPEFLEVEPLCYGTINIFRIKTGTRANPIIMDMYLFKASSKSNNAPVVISGDMCFGRVFNPEFIKSITDRDINFVLFNRTELAPDISIYNLDDLKTTETGEYKLGDEIWKSLQDGNCGGQIKKTYPDGNFSAVSAWAWGYSRCVDALEILGNVDLNLIAFTGHSRGAKTAALAGIVDERAAIVNPNATCCGGNSGYRIYMEATMEDGTVAKSERLDNIFRLFPAWMGQGMKEYIGSEGSMPFDSHDFKAMIAPRILFVSEGAHDIWANPVGSWQTTLAAGEVYKFLGCEENLYWYFRQGGHNQTPEDLEQLANIINHVRNGEKINDKFFKRPFKYIEPAYDWECPSND